MEATYYPLRSPSRKLMRAQSDLGMADVGLFDIDDLEDGLSWSPTSVFSQSDDMHNLEQSVLAVGTLCSPFSVKEDVLVRRTGRILKVGKVGSGDAQAALRELRKLGFPVSVAESRRSQGKDIFRCPRHEFLRMEVADGPDIVIDTSFRSFFAVARSSFYYSKIFEQLPEVFIGGEDRLRLLVAFMAEQLKRNFETTGMPCPPWRDTKSLLNTWAL